MIFANPGELDIRAAITMGVNVKDGVSPIGFFGTGFKYGVATLLRLGCSVTVYSGETKYTFGTKEATIRGKLFHIVTLNDQELGFTTDLGKNWEPWMAYRELYCNAKDEGGDFYPEFTPRSGYTTIIVEGNPIEQAHANRHKFLIGDRPVFLSSPDVEIRGGKASGVFYRGILVASDNTLSHTPCFTYNILAPVPLTEDRTLASFYVTWGHIRKALVESTDKIFIRRWLTSPKDTFENTLNLDWDLDFSDAFLDVCEELMRSPDRNKANPTIQAILTKTRPQAKQTGNFIPTQMQQNMLARVVALLTKAGLYAGHPISFANLGPEIYGQAKDEGIILSKRAFADGTKQLAITLLEESLHITTGHYDCTRAFQDHLMTLLISTLEEHLWGEAL